MSAGNFASIGASDSTSVWWATASTASGADGSHTPPAGVGAAGVTIRRICRSRSERSERSKNARASAVKPFRSQSDARARRVKVGGQPPAVARMRATMLSTVAATSTR